MVRMSDEHLDLGEHVLVHTALRWVMRVQPMPPLAPAANDILGSPQHPLFPLLGLLGSDRIRLFDDQQHGAEDLAGFRRYSFSEEGRQEGGHLMLAE